VRCGAIATTAYAEDSNSILVTPHSRGKFRCRNMMRHNGLLQKAMGPGDLGKFAQGVQNCVNHGISRCVPFWHVALTGAMVREFELPTFQITIGKAESASGPTSQAICTDRFKTSGTRFSRINTLIPIRPGLIPENQYFQKDVSK
jgi:hypothetical protein